MRFPKYEAYKDSGVEWLGEVPDHWHVEPLKYHAQIFPSNVDKKSYEGQTQVHLCNYTDVYYNEEIVEGMNFMSATATEEQIEKFTLRAGDTVFTKDSETADDIAIAAYVPEDLPGVICGYHLSIVRPGATTDGAFIKRFFDSHSAKAYFEVSANGLTRVGLSQYAADNIPTPIPPLSEQIQISRFLDHETARIDSLMAEQERLIELLEEKRQSVINHVVTRGLNPDAPIIESGLSWAPVVPAHWSLTPNRNLLNIRRVLVGHSHSNFVLLSLTKRGVVVRDVATGEGKHSDHLDRCQEVRPGDLVFCLFDVEETPRTIGLSNYLGMISGDYTVFECSNGLAARFMEYFYKAMDDRKLLRSLYRGLRKRIPKPQFLRVRTPMPPSDEQLRIVQYLDDLEAKLDQLMEAASRQIELLQERRSALISAAVTGKIDVRGWQAPESDTPAATLEAAYG